MKLHPIKKKFKPSDFVVFVTDASCRGTSSRVYSAYGGAIINSEGLKYHRDYIPNSDLKVDEAEIYAVYHLLKHAIKHGVLRGAKYAAIYGDNLTSLWAIIKALAPDRLIIGSKLTSFGVIFTKVSAKRREIICAEIAHMLKSVDCVYVEHIATDTKLGAELRVVHDVCHTLANNARREYEQGGS